MDKNEAVAFLARVHLFEGITKEHAELLWGLCEEVEFAADEILIEEGQNDPPFSIVIDGSIRVVLPSSSRFTRVKRSREAILNTLAAESCFGEYSMLDDMPASASVVGEKPGRMFRIDHAKLHNLLSLDDHLARIVYRNMLVELVGRLKRRESEIDRSLII